MLALGCSKHVIAGQAHDLNFMSFFTCLFVIKGFVDIEEEDRERIRESINTLEGMQSLLFALQLANSIRETGINGVTKHKKITKTKCQTLVQAAQIQQSNPDLLVQVTWF